MQGVFVEYQQSTKSFEQDLRGFVRKSPVDQSVERIQEIHARLLAEKLIDEDDNIEEE